MNLTLKGLAKGMLVAAAGLWAAHWNILGFLAYLVFLLVVAALIKKARRRRVLPLLRNEVQDEEARRHRRAMVIMTEGDPQLMAIYDANVAVRGEVVGR